MKKTLSVILVAVMILSTLVSLVVPAAAEENTGDWDVMLPAPVMNKAEDERQPAQGYYYDETGFHTVSPNYKNYTPHFTVISKEMYNIVNFSMTVEITDYCTEGDNWLSFSVWSESNGLAQGVTSGEYGDGWTSLIRPDTEGRLVKLESWNQTKGGRTGKQVFSNIDATQAIPVMLTPDVNEDNGALRFTFAITDGVVSVNGAVIGAATDKVISERFKEGLAYVGVTLNNAGDASGAYMPTISVVEVNGSVPTGSGSRDPESKTREYGELIPSDTVPENTPAVWFDGTLDKTNTKLPSTSNCDVDYSDDNTSILVTANDAAGTIQFFVPDAITYEANDFPYILMIFKNFCTCTLQEGENANDMCAGNEMGSLWYCAGNVTSPRNECHISVPGFYWATPLDESGVPTTTDYYTVALVDLSELEWEGRINNVRFDFAGFKNYAIEGMNTFEIVGLGAFATEMGAITYLQANGYNTDMFGFLNPDLCTHRDADEDGICDICYEAVDLSGGSEESTEEATDEVTEDTTEAKTEATTKAPETTTATTEENKSGCGATVSMSVLGLVALAGASMTCFKKKED